MQTNFIKKDILMIAALFFVFAVAFTALIIYDNQTDSLQEWATSLYDVLIKR